MSLECGIVGLPNVGKSTLFNTLTSAQVAAENFPFCTVDPNRGIVEVPDERLSKLADLAQPEKVVPTSVTFVDIAGLVKGASQGEGLGNQFLSHIRNVDAICHMVRCFENDNVTHVMGSVNPIRDIEIIDLELCLADYESANRRLERLEKETKAGSSPKLQKEIELLTQAMKWLEDGSPLRAHRGELAELADLEMFLTSKPLLYVANLSEDEARDPSEATKAWLSELNSRATKEKAPVVELSAALEYQLGQLEGEDRALFFEDYGLSEPGLNRLIRSAYELLGLITYFTVGPKEVRAWTIEKGQTAVEAAGKIHSDFAKGFIRAETTHYPDFVSAGGEKPAREKGLQRSEGRDYVVQDGDVMLFRFNV